MKHLATVFFALIGLIALQCSAQDDITLRKAEPQWLANAHKAEHREPGQQSGIPSAPFKASVSGTDFRTLNIFFLRGGDGYFVQFMGMPFTDDISTKGFTLLVYSDGKQFWGAKVGTKGYTAANGPFNRPPTIELLDQKANDIMSSRLMHDLDEQKYARSLDEGIKKRTEEQRRISSLSSRTDPPKGKGVPFGGILSEVVSDSTIFTRESKQSVAAKFRKASFEALRCELLPVDGHPELKIESCSTIKRDAAGQITDAYQLQFFRGYVTHIQWRFNSEHYAHYLAEAMATYGPTGIRFEWENCFTSQKQLSDHLQVTKDPNERFNVRLCSARESMDAGRNLTGAACDQGAANENLTNAQMAQCLMNSPNWVIHSKDGSSTAQIYMSSYYAGGGSVALVKDDWFVDEIRAALAGK